VCDSRALRRISGPNRGEVMTDRRTLHSEALHNLYFSPNISRVLKSRRMRQAGAAYSAHGEKENACEKNHSQGLGVDGRIILKCILGEKSLECGLH